MTDLALGVNWNKAAPEPTHCFVCRKIKQVGEKWPAFFVTNDAVQAQRRDFCGSECISKDAARKGKEHVEQPAEV